MSSPRALALVLGTCGLLSAQANSPSFEVATVKVAPFPTPTNPLMNSLQGGPGSKAPGQITYTFVTLRSLLIKAYDVPAYEIAGPAWLDSEHYTVVAKMDSGTTADQFAKMLQSLLAGRFHMVLHRERKEIQGYTLVIGKSGSKLREGTSNAGALQYSGEPDKDGFPQFDHPAMDALLEMRNHVPVALLTAKQQSTEQVAQMLGNRLQGPVVDRTGLSGLYDFKLKFDASSSLGGVPAAAAENAETSLPTAVEEQLGLKLEAKKVTVDFLIVDRGDKVPAEN